MIFGKNNTSEIRILKRAIDANQKLIIELSKELYNTINSMNLIVDLQLKLLDKEHADFLAIKSKINLMEKVKQKKSKTKKQVK